MRRSLALAVFATAFACTLDPQRVIDRAGLTVHVAGLPPGSAELELTASGSGAAKVKRARVQGLSAIDVFYEEASFPKGPVTLAGIARGLDGGELACGASLTDFDGGTAVARMALTPTTDDLNCGACGQSCARPNASASCTASGTCGPLACAPGFIDQDGRFDTGCEAKDTACTTLAAESTVAACSNGVDDDCDGKKDCADSACQGLTGACPFLTCTGVQSWNCATQTYGACASDPTREATPAACSNGVDDDCDGKTDCQDPGCQAVSESCGVSVCAGVKAWVCLTRTFGLCLPQAPVPEASDLTCGNGLDDDCDGLVDCQDPGCAGRSCGLGKLCCPDGTCKSSC